MDELYTKLKILIQENSQRILVANTLVLIISLFGTCFFLFVGYSLSKEDIQSGIFCATISLLPLSIGIIKYVICKRNIKRDSYWSDMIENTPNNIIWIKPIGINHTIVYTITLYKTQNHFQLLTKDKRSILIECKSDEEKEIFFKGIKHYLPNSHIGYNYILNDYYKQDPNNFIDFAKTNNLYQPVSQLVFK